MAGIASLREGDPVIWTRWANADPGGTIVTPDEPFPRAVVIVLGHGIASFDSPAAAYHWAQAQAGLVIDGSARMSGDAAAGGVIQYAAQTRIRAAPPAVPPVCVRNDFQGTNGVAVTVANSGAGGDPVESVIGTVVYDGTVVLSGSSSLHASLIGSSTSRVRYAKPSGDRYGRDYFRITSAPTGAPARLFQQDGGSPGAAQWGLGIDTAGQFIVRDLVVGATRLATGVNPALNTWHRMEWKPAWDSSTGLIIVTVRLFIGANLRGTTPDFEGTSSAFTQAAGGTVYNVGALFSSNTTWDAYHGSLALCDQGWIGP